MRSASQETQISTPRPIVSRRLAKRVCPDLSQEVQKQSQVPPHIAREQEMLADVFVPALAETLSDRRI